MATKESTIKIGDSVSSENSAVTDNEATTTDKNPISIAKKQKTKQYDSIYNEKIASLDNEVRRENESLAKYNGSTQNADGQPQTLQDLQADNPDKSAVRNPQAKEEPSENSQGNAAANEVFLVQKGEYDIEKLLEGLNVSSSYSTNISGTEQGENNNAQFIIGQENQTIGTINPTVTLEQLSAGNFIGEGENKNEAAIANKQAIPVQQQSNNSNKLGNPDCVGTSKILAVVDKTASGVQESGVTNKPGAYGEQNTLTNTEIPINQDKSPNIQYQLNSSDLQKAAGLIDKSADADKIGDTNQQENSGIPYNRSGTGIQAVSKSLNSNDTTDNGDNSSESNLNPEQMIYTNKTKENGDKIGDNSYEGSSYKTIKQILNVNEAQVSTGLSTEQSSRDTLASKATNNTMAGLPRSEAGEVSTSIGRQIQESIQTSLRQDQQQVTIRLNPPELGRVYIKFQEQDGQITGLLQVSKAETKSEIQQALPQMLQNLSEAGIQVKRLDVQLANQQDQQSLKEQSSPTSFSDGRSEQQNTADYNQHTNNPGWLENPDKIGTGWHGYNDFIPIDSGQVQIADNSINILA